MPWHGPKLPNPEDVVRIDCLERPFRWDSEEGLYEWRYMQEKYYLDLPLLVKEVNTVLPGKGEDIADRLMNFNRVFIIKSTGEIFSDVIPE